MAHDNQFNREVCGESAVYFRNGLELERKLKLVYRYPENYHDLKGEVYHRVLNGYGWDKITENYISLIKQLQEDKAIIRTVDMDYERRKA